MEIDTMIYDHRTYICRPGTVKQQIALYEEYGLATQVKHLGKPILYATTEVGDLNSFTHIWPYGSIAERAEKRAELYNDPDWQNYLKKSAEAGLLVEQENKILVGTDIFDKV